MTSPFWRRMQFLALAVALFPAKVSAGGRGVGLPSTVEPLTSLKQLQRLSERQLEQLYAQAEAGTPPVGFTRGQVLVLAGGPFPRAGARLSGLVWKGKHFDESGSFINQWTGFRALHSRAAYGESWFDGGPCLVLEYPAGTPLFADMRDEVRQIGPGLYLSRVYERYPTPRFRGFIGLQLEPGRGK